MNFTIHIPNNYTPPPLPGRNEWVADLRANPDKQGAGLLGEPQGPNCCLGRLSLLQGRLTRDGFDSDSGFWAGLSENNPAFVMLSALGDFPNGVAVNGLYCLAFCNDTGLTFAQIADIIEALWSDGGPLLK
jgi:hypothetical protein